MQEHHRDGRNEHSSVWASERRPGSVPRHRTRAKRGRDAGSFSPQGKVQAGSFGNGRPKSYAQRQRAHKNEQARDRLDGSSSASQSMGYLTIVCFFGRILMCGYLTTFFSSSVLVRFGQECLRVEGVARDDGAHSRENQSGQSARFSQFGGSAHAANSNGSGSIGSTDAVYGFKVIARECSGLGLLDCNIIAFHFGRASHL